MRRTGVYIIAVLLLGEVSLSHVQFHSVTESETAKALACVKVPSKDQMIADLKEQFPTGTFSANIDGFRVKNLTLETINLLHVLTFSTNAFSGRFKDWYYLTRTQNDLEIELKRSCDPSICSSSGRFDLSLLTNNPCGDILCAAETIFGKKSGVEIVWAAANLGLNLSHYQTSQAVPFENAGEKGIKTLHTVLQAALLLPEKMRKRVFSPVFSGFFLHKRIDSPKANTGKREHSVVADDTGAIYRPMLKQSVAKQVALIFHEFGHKISERLAVKRSFFSPRTALHNDEKWWSRADWEIVDLQPTKTVLSRWKPSISKYAEFDPNEDLAETIAMYRIAPDKLFKESRKRYEYVKNRIFAGQEFRNNICGDRIPSSANSTSGVSLKSVSLDDLKSFDGNFDLLATDAISAHWDHVAVDLNPIVEWGRNHGVKKICAIGGITKPNAIAAQIESCRKDLRVKKTKIIIANIEEAPMLKNQVIRDSWHSSIQPHLPNQ